MSNKLKEFTIEEVIENPKAIMDELTYGSYCANRDNGMTPDGFKTIGFPNVDVMEARYQAEAAERRLNAH